MKNKQEKYSWIILKRNRQGKVCVIDSEEQFNTIFDAYNFINENKIEQDKAQVIKITI